MKVEYQFNIILLLLPNYSTIEKFIVIPTIKYKYCSLCLSIQPKSTFPSTDTLGDFTKMLWIKFQMLRNGILNNSII